MSRKSSNTTSVLRVGGLILCGGRSSRMGTSKHQLRFGPETCLQRVVRTVMEVVSPVVVVGSPQQEIHSLPEDIILVQDTEEFLGPLAGFCTGMAALPGHVDAVYLTGCDVPLLRPEFVHAVLDEFDEQHDIVVPADDGFLHPLAAVYRSSLTTLARERVSCGELRLSEFVGRCRTKQLPIELLRTVDPGLESLRNMNSPQDYEELLSLAGFR